MDGRIEFAASELNPPPHDFKSVRSRTLGKGASGLVYLAEYHKMKVAVKIIREEIMDDESAKKEIDRECQILLRLPHRNVSRLYGFQLTSPACMVLELAELGSLYDILKNKTKYPNLPWQLRLSIAMDIVKGLMFLHNRSTLHRDIKSLNILIRGNWEAFISDFGLAKIISLGAATQGLGSFPWMAPEMNEKVIPTYKVDIYSLAMIFYELLTRQIPFGIEKIQSSQISLLVSRGSRPIIPPIGTKYVHDMAGCPKGYVELMRACWAQDPTKRPSLEDILTRLEELAKDVEASVRQAPDTLKESEPELEKLPPRSSNCEECESDAIVSAYCGNCKLYLCEKCDESLHRLSTRAKHQRMAEPLPPNVFIDSQTATILPLIQDKKQHELEPEPLPLEKLPSRSSNCEECESDAKVSAYCGSCGLYLCDKCDENLHRLSTRAKHQRVELEPEHTSLLKKLPPRSPNCEECESDATLNAYCGNCGLYLCEKCDESLHRLITRAKHQRMLLSESSCKPVKGGLNPLAFSTPKSSSPVNSSPTTNPTAKTNSSGLNALVFEGKLNKRKDKWISGWQERRVQLFTTELKYYHKNDPSPAGTIKLKHVKNIQVLQDGVQFHLVLHTDETYCFQAADKVNAQRWLQEITKCKGALDSSSPSATTLSHSGDYSGISATPPSAPDYGGMGSPAEQSSSSGTTFKAGHVSKRSSTSRHVWNKRYLVLEVERLVWYTKKSEHKKGQPHGKICVNDILYVGVSDIGKGADRGIRFNIMVRGVTYCFLAETSNDAYVWVHLITALLPKREEVEESPPEPVFDPKKLLQSGHLKKKKKNRNWKRRYVELYGDRLEYAERIGKSSEKLGRIDLANVENVEFSNDGNGFEIQADEHYFFEADSKDACQIWVTLITTAVSQAIKRASQARVDDLKQIAKSSSSPSAASALTNSFSPRTRTPSDTRLQTTKRTSSMSVYSNLSQICPSPTRGFSLSVLNPSPRAGPVSPSIRASGSPFPLTSFSTSDLSLSRSNSNDSSTTSPQHRSNPKVSVSSPTSKQVQKSLVKRFTSLMSVKKKPKKDHHLTILLVGDHKVGKTSFLYSYINDQFPDTTTFSFLFEEKVDQKDVKNMYNGITSFTFYDMPEIKEETQRKLYYTTVDADIILILFSLTSGISLKNCETRIKEINEYNNGSLKYLIGTKLDLRDNEGVSCDDGTETSNEIGATKYMECSALTGIGIKEIIQETTKLGEE